MSNKLSSISSEADKAELSSERLENLRKEYKEFAYAVSHDLKAPIRHLRQFGDLLFAGLEGKLSEDDKELITFIRSSIDLLEEQLEGLLVYSRLNTRHSDMVAVDCEELVKDLVEDLHKERGYDVSGFISEDLPEIKGDAPQIKQLFYHLLDNAFKFNVDNPVVTLCCERQDDNYVFSLKDNGIGIPAGMYDSVFQMFRKLNRQGEYPGLGVGLALAQKIVERHGGEVWIESSGSEGTLIQFSLAGR